jgi:hypothetical protein
MAFSKARRLANLMSTASDTVPASKVNTVLADDAVTTAKIADDAITTALIADGSITAAKLAADATIAKLSSAPSVGSEGSLYYNTTTDKLYLSNGTAWLPLDTNAPPTTTGGTVTIPTQAGASTFSYNLGLNFTDEDIDANLTYTLESGTLPAGAVLPTSGNTALTGTATSQATATYNFVIRATDAKAAFATQAFTQVITNTLPTATGGTVTIATQAGLSTFSYNLGLNFSDAQDADAALTYTLASGTLPAGAVLPTSGNTALTGTATNTAATYNFVIRATDTVGGAVTQAFTQVISLTFAATGGTITTAGGYKYHTFNSSGTFAINISKSCDIMTLAGGAGGGSGSRAGGGGGAGGLIETNSSTISAASHTITIGAGGAGSNTSTEGTGGNGASGSNTVAFSATAIGGGAGGGKGVAGLVGGSGGGAGRDAGSVTPAAGTSGQGYAGGTGIGTSYGDAGGGGGKAGVGGTGTSGSGGSVAGDGGIGLNWKSLGNFYAGGGGGTSYRNNTGAIGAGGSGVGGRGGYGETSTTRAGVAATPANRGSGGGGGYPTGGYTGGGNGSSGTVIIRYAV